MLLGDVVALGAHKYGDRAAIIFGDRTITFAAGRGDGTFLISSPGFPTTGVPARISGRSVSRICVSFARARSSMP